MKKFTFLAFTAFSIFLSSTADAQKVQGAQKMERCGTMQHLEMWQGENRDVVEANQKEIERLLKNPGSAGSGNRLQAIVTVPVVFHIVLPNPFVVTDADIQAQLDRLNLDYSGDNADSANIPASFQAVRGRSQIRFVLARRTPTGQPTNGIERRASSTVYTGGTNDPIKSAAQGGLAVWDATQYMNIWVGTGGGLLGYATFPGTSNATQQGIVTDIIGTAANPCYVDPNYNLGRTLTHEVGHYLGLYHIWGDEGGCTNSDFRNLPGTCVISDATLAGLASDQAVGDTPNQGNENFGCPSGNVANSCGNADGDMYQNYMDYTNDACMTMFTAKQAARMEWVIANCRAGYLTTLGGTPPAGGNNWDALPAASVNPGGFELNGCNVISYTDAFSCAGNIAPKFRVTNNGLNTITSLVVGYRLNNGTAVTQTVTVNIPTGGSYIASFPAFSAPIGNHTFKFFTSDPNGNADQTPANDTLVQAFRVMAPVVTPVFEGFESAPPFTSFTIDNRNGDVTWTRTTPGRGGSAGKLTMDNYNADNTNTIDDIRSTSITVDPTRSYSLSFDVAHRNYPTNGFHDTLSVLVSTNCGQTFTTVYKKWGATLATNTATTSAYTTPAASDWRTEIISLNGALVASGQIVVVIRNTGKFGNYIHLDNINLSSFQRDLRVVSINAPGTSSCSSTITPSVTISNEGSEAVTSFKVGYRFDNGTNTITTFNQTINPGASATVTLPAGSTTSGAHVIWAFTADPVAASGTGDQGTRNDTLSKSFTVVNLLSPPIREGFETAFPPAGWTIFNPNNNLTWVRTTPGRNSTYSAFIDNFSTNTNGQIDEMRLPFLNVGGADSVVVSFDVAHRNYPGSNDTLRVLATTDCGNSFTSVYGKAGAGLATGTSSTAAFLTPTAAQWRNERISIGGPLLSTGSLGIYFRNRSAFGNNIFIDNINIDAFYKRDLQLVSINGVNGLVCTSTTTPSVTVRNVGLETVTGFKVSYTVNGSGLQTATATGLTLARNGETNLTLPVINTGTPGRYNLVVYSLDPITASGTGDMNTRNDTLRIVYSVPGTAAAPLSETFVGTTFPPTNWSIINPDGGLTWSRSNIGNGNAGSAFMNTYNYPSNGQRDDLLTPLVTYSGVDSVRLSFDVAASTYSYPGSTAIPIDTLEVLVTRDCGNTFTSVYKKWGNELQTVNDPNTPQSTEFFPNAANNWRRETINLSQFAAQSPLLVMFRVSNNFENNIFIDNVNLNTQVLPTQLKQQGYLVYPTAFQNGFNVWHFQTPTTLRYINVVNSAGQLVYSKQFNGNADRQMQIDLTGRAAGVYTVEVGYQDANRNVVQRVVKY